MFPKINPLPCPKGQPPILERNHEVYGRKRRANMRGHIVLALCGVLEKFVTIGNQPRKEALQIAPDFRIGILLNQERR